MKKEIVHIALKNLLKTRGIEGEWQAEAALDNTLQVEIENTKQRLFI